MNGWILSLVGIAFLGVMVDIVAPNGSVNKFIKSIFSIFVLYIVISPIFKMINNDWNKSIYTNNLEYNYSFLTNYNINLAKEYSNRIENSLLKLGIDGVKIEILVNLTDLNFCIQEVDVDISKLVLTDEINNINKYEEIEKVVYENLGEGVSIVFNE